MPEVFEVVISGRRVTGPGICEHCGEVGLAFLSDDDVDCPCLCHHARRFRSSGGGRRK